MFPIIFLLLLFSSPLNARPTIAISLTPLAAGLVSSAIAAYPTILLGKVLVGSGFLLGGAVGGKK